MSLEEYQRKRDLTKSPEPRAKHRKPENLLRFVIHKHAASHLHYDLRLELDGVLKSWAVPKGPSLDPSIKRLAMLVEDHPYDYREFEGVIPKGNYGAGEVIIWDAGTYHALAARDREQSEKLLREGFDKGDLKFVLEGHKLKGEFALVRMQSEKDNTWLLLKKHDDYATREDVTAHDRSVVSNASIEDLKGNPAGLAKPVQAAQLEKTGKKLPQAPMPREVKPMLATSVKEPFNDPEWIFELKLDGYRCIAEIERGKVALYSRNNISFNLRFATVARTLASIARDAVLDGEIVALDEEGRSLFQLLQNSVRTGQGNICYFIFDLLYLDGSDLRGLPLLERKEMLRNLLPDLADIRYCDHIVELGQEFFALAIQNNLEGIVAKRNDSRYQTGKRTRDWLKIKIRRQQEAVICGFTKPRGSRQHFGSLVLGVYQKGELVFIGLAGGGFDESGLKKLHALLEPLVLPGSPFREQVKTDTPVKWVKPVLVCEVEFSEWTDEMHMRHPIFLGLRDDKDPQTVVREEFSSEAPAPPAAGSQKAENSSGGRSRVKNPQKRGVVIDGHRLELSNLDKVFWPSEGFTKGDVIEYYRAVARWMLPHLQDRPESLYRTPNGIIEGGFFQKEAGELPPPWVTTREIFSKHVDKRIKYFVCQDEATLVYMANLGCIEINPWLSRLQSLNFPDYFVIDLDPEDIPFPKVIEAALAVHEVLERAGAPSFPKTSGATGMHIYVPLAAKYDYDTAEKFARLVAALVHQLVPDFTSLERSPRKRQKKVYLDFLQNKPGQTLAAPYSIRPRPGATVSAPLTWDEVRPGLEPGQFTIKNMPSRLEKRGDLFRGVLGAGIDLEACLENLGS